MKAPTILIGCVLCLSLIGCNSRTPGYKVTEIPLGQGQFNVKVTNAQTGTSVTWLYDSDQRVRLRYGRECVEFDQENRCWRYFNIDAPGGKTIENNDRDTLLVRASGRYVD